MINDEEFITAILQHRFERKPSWLLSMMGPFVKAYLKFKWAKLNSVEAIQLEVKKYLQKTLSHTTKGVTYSGLEKLGKDTAYLFVSYNFV